MRFLGNKKERSYRIIIPFQWAYCVCVWAGGCASSESEKNAEPNLLFLWAEFTFWNKWIMVFKDWDMYRTLFQLIYPLNLNTLFHAHKIKMASSSGRFIVFLLLLLFEFKFFFVFFEQQISNEIDRFSDQRSDSCRAVPNNEHDINIYNQSHNKYRNKSARSYHCRFSHSLLPSFLFLRNFDLTESWTVAKFWVWLPNRKMKHEYSIRWFKSSSTLRFFTPFVFVVVVVLIRFHFIHEHNQFHLSAFPEDYPSHDEK